MGCGAHPDYREELKKTLSRLPAGNPCFDLIADLTQLPPQSQEIARMHGTIMEQGRGIGLRFAAHVVTNPITKLQMSRVAACDDFAYFATDSEATAWLDGKRSLMDQATVPVSMQSR